MKNHVITILVSKNYKGILISELIDLGFHGFEEVENSLIAYIESQKLTRVYQKKIKDLLKKYPGNNRIISEQEIAERNWNESWEATIEPQVIGKFVVIPTWSSEPVPDDKIPLLIDPKMSFGTGYHATTRLMLKALPEIINQNASVFDVGTGTGILCIAAIKLGAGDATGVDIDEWSYQNALENIELNDVSNSITIKHGSVDLIPEDREYSIIMANINRNIIDDLAVDILKRLSQNGSLLLSGLLQEDIEALEQQSWFTNLTLEQSWYEDEWMALLLHKVY